LRDSVDGRLIAQDPYEELVNLWLDPENNRPVSLHEARQAAAHAFLLPCTDLK